MRIKENTIKAGKRLIKAEKPIFDYMAFERLFRQNIPDDGDWKVDDIVITDAGSFGVCNLVDLIYMNGFEQPTPP